MALWLTRSMRPSIGTAPWERCSWGGGGAIPGFLLGLYLLVAGYIIARIRGFPKERMTLRETIRAFFYSLPALAIPVIVLGGIVGGIFTPTEASAVAVVWAAVMGAFVFRTLGPAKMAWVFLESMKTSAAVLFIVVMASAFSWVITLQQVGVPSIYSIVPPNDGSALRHGHHFEPVDFVINHGRGRHDAYSAGSCQRTYARACGCRQRPRRHKEELIESDRGWSGREAFVTMMQTADLGQGNDRSGPGRLNGSSIRCVLADRQVGP